MPIPAPLPIGCGSRITSILRRKSYGSQSRRGLVVRLVVVIGGSHVLVSLLLAPSACITARHSTQPRRALGFAQQFRPPCGQVYLVLDACVPALVLLLASPYNGSKPLVRNSAQALANGPSGLT